MMTKDVRDQAAYDIAMKFAEGENVEEFAKSFIDAYAAAQKALKPEKTSEQRISF